MSQENLSSEEKLDYIYNYIRKEQRNNRLKSILKWIIRILFIAYLFYSYFVLWPEIKNNFLLPMLKPLGVKEVSISEIKNLFNKFGELSKTIDGVNSSSDSINGGTINISKEKLDQIKSLLNKKQDNTY